MTSLRHNLRRSWRWTAAAAALAMMLLALLGLRGELASAAGKQVEIENLAYKPKTLHVARGTRVVFENRDNVAHTVTRKGSFDSGSISPGGSFAVRFKHRGRFRFHCSIHPFMHGKVVVR
jgi:plastocyanin